MPSGVIRGRCPPADHWISPGLHDACSLLFAYHWLCVSNPSPFHMPRRDVLPESLVIRAEIQPGSAAVLAQGGHLDKEVRQLLSERAAETQDFAALSPDAAG